jgi:hypothetical protein
MYFILNGNVYPQQIRYHRRNHVPDLDESVKQFSFLFIPHCSAKLERNWANKPYLGGGGVVIDSCVSTSGDIIRGRSITELKEIH